MRRISHDTLTRRASEGTGVIGELLPVTDRTERLIAICNRPHDRNGHHKTTNPRAGFSLLEMFVAVVVFGTVLMTFLPLMQSVGKQQRMTDQRLLALREANNVLEQLSQRKWNELIADELAKVKLPDDVKSRLPQAALQIDLSEPAEQPPSKRVAVKLSWTPRSGQAAQSVQLATWFFQTEGQP